MNEPLSEKRESHLLNLESYERALALYKLANRQAAILATKRNENDKRTGTDFACRDR